MKLQDAKIAVFISQKVGLLFFCKVTRFVRNRLLIRKNKEEVSIGNRLIIFDVIPNVASSAGASPEIAALLQQLKMGQHTLWLFGESEPAQQFLKVLNDNHFEDVHVHQAPADDCHTMYFLEQSLATEELASLN